MRTEYELEESAENRSRLSQLMARNMRTPRMAAIAISVLIVVAVGVFSVVRSQAISHGSVAMLEELSPDEAVLNPLFSDDSGSVVHVVGAVNNPGVYALKHDARVLDAIDAAGGATAEAALVGVNLARIVTDGEQLRIPTSDEVESMELGVNGSANQIPGATGGQAPFMVNINRATAAELETLPGIGPALAARIVDWRTANGSFKSVDDLDAVSGIGSKMLERIRALVSI